MSYIDLLEYSYKTQKDNGDSESRLEYLSECVFDFTTYDESISELFASKALEVCLSITNRTTFDYQNKSADNYRWYLLMCNMPFFADRISWGGSVRGAFWYITNAHYFSIYSCGFWEDDNQIENPVQFDLKQWDQFILDMVEFASEA